MKVIEIQAIAKADGASIGSPYSTVKTIAENVEGQVIRRATPYEAYQLVITDDTGKLTVNISSSSYVKDKTKYNLVIANADRDIKDRKTNEVFVEKNTKMLRAI